LLTPGGLRAPSGRSDRRENRTRWDGKPIKSKSDETETGALGQRGLAIKNPNQKHPLRHYRGGSTVSALEAACVYYAGVQLLLPGHDPGMDLGREYAMARGMVGEETEAPNAGGSP
jgi:hypothetical protein